ncbi:MAG: 3-deoxy-D-manno-octulosonic acid transferase [Burkholderiales bacterium]|nr:3-deoxy-D-manno-octulosonic acid transferase [Burkholderiales bacterium]
MRFLYTLTLMLMLPLILARLIWRSFRQRGYRENIGERFGLQSKPALKNCIWIHAVSVGEARAAEPLIRRLMVVHPEHSILLTSMTPTGRATAVELFGDAVTSTYLPYDFVALHQRLIEHFRPVLLLVMETEIWPNLFHTCRRNQIPAQLINARMSEKSARGYMRFAFTRALARQALQTLRVVAAQSEADADRFRMIGAKEVFVTGNIKFDVNLDSEMLQLGKQWRAAASGRRILLCASTREGEESLLLAAYAQVFNASERLETLFVIVPRHPQRFDLVANEVHGTALRCSRRSRTMPGATYEPSEVLLGDSMGEMTAYYAFCDIAIIGGSFLPLGGQNLIEACAVGRPVIMGPSTFNFSEAARLAVDAGAMVPVENALEAMRTSQRLLRDHEAQKTMAAAGLKLVAANRGATMKTMMFIDAALGVS